MSDHLLRLLGAVCLAACAGLIGGSNAAAAPGVGSSTADTMVTTPNVQIVPSSVAQSVTFPAPFDQRYCDAWASAHHTTPVSPCTVLVKFGAGPASSAAPSGASSMSPDGLPWQYVNSYIETCDQPSPQTGPECTVWDDKVNISYQYNGTIVEATSVTPASPSYCCGYGLTNTWSGCGNWSATGSGHIGCGDNFTLCWLFGQDCSSNDGQRLYVDVDGNLSPSPQCWVGSGGCAVVYP